MQQQAQVFDTHRFVKELASAGMPVEQAEVFVEVQTRLLGGTLASKADFVRLSEKIEGELKLMRQKHTADIEALGQKTQSDIEALRQETKAGIKTLRAYVENLKTRMHGNFVFLRWMLGFVFAATVWPLVERLPFFGG